MTILVVQVVGLGFPSPFPKLVSGFPFPFPHSVSGSPFPFPPVSVGLPLPFPPKWNFRIVTSSFFFNSCLNLRINGVRRYRAAKVVFGGWLWSSEQISQVGQDWWFKVIIVEFVGVLECVLRVKVTHDVREQGRGDIRLSWLGHLFAGFENRRDTRELNLFGSPFSLALIFMIFALKTSNLQAAPQFNLGVYSTPIHQCFSFTKEKPDILSVESNESHRNVTPYMVMSLESQVMKDHWDCSYDETRCSSLSVRRPNRVCQSLRQPLPSASRGLHPPSSALTSDAPLSTRFYFVVIYLCIRWLVRAFKAPLRKRGKGKGWEEKAESITEAPTTILQVIVCHQRIGGEQR
ncbi:hypothetical protein BVRB_9g204020 [Beta vulgaris subsp. vulgaris]|nr:hypothetical protein BVRB_9g204020 [Beta vulgaris subsp. vulgaris]